MKINNNQGLQVNKLYKAQAEDKTKANRQHDSATADTLSISAEAAKVQKLVQTAAAATDVRMDKVNQLKDAIAKGEFTPDSKKIAQAMLKIQD